MTYTPFRLKRCSNPACGFEERTSYIFCNRCGAQLLLAGRKFHRYLRHCPVCDRLFKVMSRSSPKGQLRCKDCARGPIGYRWVGFCDEVVRE